MQGYGDTFDDGQRTGNNKPDAESVAFKGESDGEVGT